MGYTKRACTWEFSKIYLRVIILAISELIDEEKIIIKHILIASILIVYCYSFYFVQPYDVKEFKKSEMNNLDLLANLGLLITIYQSHLAFTIRDEYVYSGGWYWLRKGSFYVATLFSN